MKTAMIIVLGAVTFGGSGLGSVGAAAPSAPVTLRVIVSDADGRPVEGLGPDDFRVTFNDTSSEVITAGRAPGPSHIAVIVDLTTSWLGGPRTGQRDVSRFIDEQLIPGLRDEVQVLVVGVARSLRIAPGWSRDREVIRRWLRDVIDAPGEEQTGPSAIWDALHHVIHEAQPNEGRLGVVLVTDGQATGNRYGLSEVADLAILRDVPVHPVFTGRRTTILQSPQMVAAVRPDRSLIHLATVTGGVFVERPFPLPRDWSAPDPLRQAAIALASVYQLGVVAPTRAGFHRVSVTTRDPAHVVSVRLGVMVRD